jgi:hypothetical protein
MIPTKVTKDVYLRKYEIIKYELQEYIFLKTSIFDKSSSLNSIISVDEEGLSTM